MKHIVVTCTVVLNDYPPAVALVVNLLKSGYKVSLLACGNGGCLPQDVIDNPDFNFVHLGERGGSLFERTRLLISVPNAIRAFLSKNRADIDLVWTTFSTDARDAGLILRDFPHVMQISELTERVPAFCHANRPPYSKRTIELARNAKRVVVPEYNRAFIQQALWRLPETPAVLPNKPAISKNASFNLPIDDDRLVRIMNEKRKVVLYQGLFADDRDLFPFADAIDMLGGEFVLYLMGKAVDSEQQNKLDQLLATHSNIEYIGFVQAPTHLAFTRYAHIGLLPYSASYDGACHPLNALYCAPNKIWEYSCYGIPMLGSDIPGLTGIFARYNCGLTTLAKPHEIARAIVEIDASRTAMGEGSSILYDSVDTRKIAERIVEEAVKG